MGGGKGVEKHTVSGDDNLVARLLLDQGSQLALHGRIQVYAAGIESAVNTSTTDPWVVVIKLEELQV